MKMSRMDFLKLLGLGPGLVKGAAKLAKPDVLAGRGPIDVWNYRNVKFFSVPQQALLMARFWSDLKTKCSAPCPPPY